MGIEQAGKTEKKIFKPSRTTGNNRILYFLIAVIAGLVYINTSGHGYVYDDFVVITGNSLTAKGIKSIPELLQTSYCYGMTGSNDAIFLYRPFSLITLAVENEISNNDPVINHIFNILFYILTFVVLFHLLLKLFSNYHKAIPFAVVLLWIVHPIHTEVVANIKSRDEILSFLFSILSLNFFLYGRTIFKSFGLGGLCYFIALLSKESALTYLFVTPLSIYYFNYDRKKLIYTVSAMAFLSLVYYLLRDSVLVGNIANSEMKIIHNSLLAAPDFISREATAVKTLGLYMLKFFVPINLSSDYSYNQIPVSTVTSPGFLLSAVCLSGLLIYALIKAKGKDMIAFGILFFFITISIVSNLLVIIGSNMGDRFMYTPSLGLCIAFVFLLVKLFKLNVVTTPGSVSVLQYAFRQKIPALIVTLVAVLFSVKTITRNLDWKSNRTLFTADYRNSPKSARMKVYYGKELMKIAKDNSVDTAERNRSYATAFRLFADAAAIDNTWELPYVELALAYSYRGYPEKALQFYGIARQIAPDDYLILNNTGNSYFDLAQYDSAMIYMKKSLAVKYNNPDALGNLGSCYGVLGQYDSAFKYYNAALEIRPNDLTMLKNMGAINFQLGRYAAAIRYYEQALTLDPANASIKQSLESARAAKGNLGK